MEQFSQEKTLEVERGLFLIKYEWTANSTKPPRVELAAEPGSTDAVELILPPDAHQAVLWAPGASLVARVATKSRLRVVVVPTEPNGSTAAQVRVVALSNDPKNSRPGQPSQQLDLSDFRLLAHVAGRGDVIAEPGNWIAGPSAPSRIEGISIAWAGKPQNLTLRYAVAVAGSNTGSGFVEPGNFVGTRGRALPLVGAVLEISGPGAADQQLLVDSLFLGSPQMRATGRRVVLSGPTGREPLVGLRVRIAPVETADSRQHAGMLANAGERQVEGPSNLAHPALSDQRASLPPASLPSARKPGRVRVFRSGPRAKPLQTSS